MMLGRACFWLMRLLQLANELWYNLFRQLGGPEGNKEKRKMVKLFTEEEKDKIDCLYRKDGWAIKKIARHLKVSDKRVSAYIKGMMEDKPIDSCGNDECKKKIDAGKDEFLSYVKESIKIHAESCYKFVEAVNSFILGEVIEVLTEDKLQKKEIKKRCYERLDKLFKETMDMTHAAGIASVLTMPPCYKKAFLSNLHIDALGCINKSRSKNSNKCKK